jgi:DNA-binding CsgD family transcriptional regulator
MGAMTRRGGARAAALGLRVSGRESQVLRWVAAGKSDWEIGMILRISEKTVNFHVQNAKRKLGVGTRIQAVVAAMREGLIDDDPSIARDFDWPMG